MTERALRVSQALVRTVGLITVTVLMLLLLCDRYYPVLSHELANSALGSIVVAYVTIVSLLLLPYVGLEGWWAKRLQSTSNALWIDAALATACLALFLLTAWYGLTHYFMS